MWSIVLDAGTTPLRWDPLCHGHPTAQTDTGWDTTTDKATRADHDHDHETSVLTSYQVIKLARYGVTWLLGYLGEWWGVPRCGTRL